MAITLNGAVVNTVSGGSGTTLAGTITTTLTNDIIVLTIHALNTGLPAISGVSGGGLTWTRRSTHNTAAFNNGSGNARQLVEVWWALATGTLTSQAITATFSAGYDAASMTLSAWNGCDTSTPWDVNASLPKTAQSAAPGTGSIPTCTSVSTTNANTVIIAVQGSQDPVTPTAGATYTLDQGVQNANSFAFEIYGLEHKIVSAAQSAVSVPFGASMNDWLMITDALQQAGAGGGTDPFHKLDWPTVLNIPGSSLQSNNRNPLQFPNPIPFAQNDWAPVKPFQRVGQPQYGYDPKNFTNPQPFTQLSWPSGNSLQTPVSRTPPQAYNQNLYTVVVTAPFTQTQWPQPNNFNPRVAQLPVNIPILDFLSTPFRVVDTSPSKFLRPDAPDGILQINLNLIPNPIPFAQYDWSKPDRVAQPFPQSEPYNLSNFNQVVVPFNLMIGGSWSPRFSPDQQPYNPSLYTTIVVQSPFFQTDWSKTEFLPHVPDATQQTNINIFTNPIPFSQMDWSKTGFQNPRAPDLQAYLQTLNQVIVLPSPFSQLDWSKTGLLPHTPDGTQQTNINAFTNPLPFSKQDWGVIHPVTPIPSHQNDYPNIAGTNPSVQSTPLGLFYWTDWGKQKWPIIIVSDQNNLPNIVLPNTIPVPPEIIVASGRWIKGMEAMLRRKAAQQTRSNTTAVRQAAAILSKMGGIARAQSLTANQRSKIASTAAKARWR